MEKSKKQIRTRIAPSPTGPLHLGIARTALFNYLFARQNKGKFILRIEDTDIERSKKEYEKDVLENLDWLGLKWDEGPFRQSERSEIYEKHIKKMVDSGQAFWCSHNKEELEKEKKEQMGKGQAPRHICDRKGKEKKGIIRFSCPDKKIIFNDLIRGQLEFNTGPLGDIGIARDKKTPLYNLSVVIDDYEMNISHIIRGEDHIPNTPKQLLLIEALGFEKPEYAHLPLILGQDKSKLSKRHGAVSMGWYNKQGYLKEALINFIVLLGWNPGTEKEIFSLDELIKEFSLERVHKGGAVFNTQRLDWLNAQYIKKMDLNELTKRCLPYLPKKIDFLKAKKIVALEQERMKKLSEIGETTEFFFKEKLEYPKELLIWREMTLKEIKEKLNILEENLSKIDKFDAETLKGVLMPLAEKHGSGELLWPLRAALTGQKASPGPFEIAEILGKEETLKRIKEAQEKIIK